MNPFTTLSQIQQAYLTYVHTFQKFQNPAIRDRRLPLPDAAQKIIYDGDEPIATADFFYAPRILVFGRLVTLSGLRCGSRRTQAAAAQGAGLSRRCGAGRGPGGGSERFGGPGGRMRPTIRCVIYHDPPQSLPNRQSDHPDRTRNNQAWR